jgi:hypothetical protein
MKQDLAFIPSSINHLVYLILVTCTAFIVYHLFNDQESYWLIWSALTFSLLSVGDTFKSRIITLLLTGIAASISAFLATCFVFQPPLLALYLFIITLICMGLSQRYSHYFFPLFIINLFAILASSQVITFSEAGTRLLFTLTGLLIALVFQLIFYFRFAQNESQWFIILSLRQLKKLNDVIFSCFLQPEYADNIYLYEHRLHVQKNNCLRAICRLRDLLHYNKKPELGDKQEQFLVLQNKLDQVFDLLLDCSQLRRRVTDHTTFAICTNELAAICQEIDRLFEGLIGLTLGKKLFPNVSMLQEKIGKLEESYNHVLQISSREPLVFLLFIFSLRALASEMITCYELLGSR